MGNQGIRWCMLTAILLLPSGIACATTLDEISVLSLSAVEGSAVLQFSDGKMAVVHVGDIVPGVSIATTVRQVLSDRLVVETSASVTQTRPEIVWIYRSQKGAKSRVQRLDSQGPQKSMETVEVTKVLKR